MTLATDNGDVLLAEDARSRERALAPGSWLVEAPAGAGKTELLTQRFLRLMAQVDEPEEVVALTFTNKAAGEMRDRVLGALALARQPGDPEQPHRRVTRDLGRDVIARAAARGWSLEANPGRLRILTLDALCASLARQMPLLSRFGAQPGLTDDARALYEEAARRALSAIGEEGTDGEAVATLLDWLDNALERATGLIADMLTRREQWGPLLASVAPEGSVGQAFDALIGNELEGIVRTLSPAWQQHVMPQIRQAGDNLGNPHWGDWQQTLGAQIAELPDWRALTVFFLTAEGNVRRRLTKNEGFVAGQAGAAHRAAFMAVLEGLVPAEADALRRVRGLPLPLPGDDVNEGEASVLQAMVTVLRRASAELWLLFRERGEVDFVELSMRAIAALGAPEQPSDLAERLDYRLRHLLVDEFQDTSPTQVRLLEALTRGWVPGDGRSLFLVGDPMQSIYRFREADVGLFLQAREAGVGGLSLGTLQLRRNNRSCPAVVAWINSRFGQILPAGDDPTRGQVAYRHFAATREAQAGQGVFLHPLPAGGAGEDINQAEARQALALIRRLQAEGGTRHIAVLARNRDHLTPLATLLRQQGEGSYTAVDVDPLLTRQPVQDLLSLTRALHHRGDRLHWVSVLRAPWCGLRLADLHRLLLGGDHRTVWELLEDGDRLATLSPDGQVRLAGVRAAFAAAWQRQGSQSRRDWVESAWLALGGMETLPATGDVADVRAFLDRLDVIDRRGFVLDRLEQDLRQLYAAPDPLADGSLQLMTMHKAKGLEFDTVILLGLHRLPRNADTPLLAWDQVLLDGEETLLAAPLNRRQEDASDATPSRYDYLQGLERDREQSEEARLLYVAATRAIRDLHLPVVLEPDDDGGFRTPPQRSLLGRLWPVIKHEVLAQPADQQSSAAAVAASGLPSVRPPADFAPPLRRRAEPLPAATATVLAPVQTPMLRAAAPILPSLHLAPRRAALLGTLVHACLEQCIAAPSAWHIDALPQRVPAMVSWGRQRGWPSREVDTLVREACAMLTVTLSSTPGRWVLSPHPGAVAEWAMTEVDGSGTVRTRVMDRSFVADGMRWIIDYKTATPVRTEEEPDALALRAHAEGYRQQLEGYAGLFAGEGLPQRLAILYVAYGKLVVLDYNCSQ